MKALRYILIICATICCFVSCKKTVDMTLMQKTVLENADIRQIKVDDAWQVTLVADSNTYVELQYSAYLEPYLKTKMDGTKLEIGFTSSVYPVINSVFCAIVHTPRLEKLEAIDATRVQCEGVFNSQSQSIEIVLSDAAQCSGLSIYGTTCEVEMHEAALLTGFTHYGTVFNATLKGASQFNGQVLASELLDITLNDASRFVNKGTVTELSRLHLSNASLLNMAETQSNRMEVELTSGSEATVQVIDFLNGSIQEASTLYYKGNPQIDIDCSEDSQLIPF